MIPNIISQIKNIFIGRKDEIAQLKDIWDLACQEGEHFVYVMLNAPGIGKTTLTSYFGKKLENEGKGIYLDFLCKSDLDSKTNLIKDLIKFINGNIQKKREIIQKFIQIQKNPAIKMKAFQQCLKDIDTVLEKKELTLNDLYDILNDFSDIIPIFFCADEIQEFQKLIFTQTKEQKTEETALHFFTNLLKMLLRSKILFILSGTRYHILTQIGVKIGSPIRQKVKPLIITRFNIEEMHSYSSKINDIIINAKFTINSKSLPILIKNYQRFLFAFTNGHPRTISIITEMFLSNIEYFLKSAEFQDYDLFLNFFLPIVEKTINPTLLNREIAEFLLEMNSNRMFPVVKKWIITGAYNEQFLGPAPEIENESQSNEAINDLIYQLMNLGFLIQNGNLNYYITSYFHFLAFLQPFNDPHEAFLKQILNNKYFELICGRDAGFGFTFENIFATVLLLDKKHFSLSENHLLFSFQPIQLRVLQNISEELLWKTITFEPNILYYTPYAKGIDFICVRHKTLMLLQITTSNPPDLKKITKLNQLIKEIISDQKHLVNYEQITGWFISLFGVLGNPLQDPKIMIISGKDLIPILGEELFNRLCTIKTAFRSVS